MHITTLPIQHLRTPSVSLLIYRGKHIGTDQWLDPALQQKTEELRQSYNRYGNVPSFDSFDKNAAIYLACTEYRHKSGLLLDEWLSARFIFADHALTPNELHELLQCLYHDQPVIEILRTPTAVTQPEHIAIVSRICGSSGKFITVDNCPTVPLVQKSQTQLRYTAYAFAFMIKQFLDDYHSWKDIQFIVGLFRNELITKSLTIQTEAKPLPTFHHGVTLFPDAPLDALRIDRDIAAYNFPAYFFNTDSLNLMLQGLITDGQLSQHSVASHLKNPEQIIHLMKGETLSYREFCNMGPLFTRCGSIPSSLMSGEELRAMIVEKVPDGPEFRVLKIRQWEEEFMELIATIVNTGA